MKGAGCWVALTLNESLETSGAQPQQVILIANSCTFVFFSSCMLRITIGTSWQFKNIYFQMLKYLDIKHPFLWYEDQPKHEPDLAFSL